MMIALARWSRRFASRRKIIRLAEADLAKRGRATAADPKSVRS